MFLEARERSWFFLASFSASPGTIRFWRLEDDADDEEEAVFEAGLSGLPLFALLLFFLEEEEDNGTLPSCCPGESVDRTSSGRTPWFDLEEEKLAVDRRCDTFGWLLVSACRLRSSDGCR